MTWQVRIEWDPLRIGLLYGPAWFCILITFMIYAAAGRDIFNKRRALRAFTRRTTPVKEPAPALADPGLEVANPFTAFKTTEVHVTSELRDLNNRNDSRGSQHIDDLISHVDPRAKSYQQYSVNISHDASRSTPPPIVKSGSANQHQLRQANAAMEANTAAWGYTKCALLFFVSLLFTWVPSSMNRVYSLLYPDSVSYGLNFAAALVLPLMGFWNAVIYITTSWVACRGLFKKVKGIHNPYRPQTRSYSIGWGTSGRKTKLELDDAASLTRKQRESHEARSEGDSLKLTG